MLVWILSKPIYLNLDFGSVLHEAFQSFQQSLRQSNLLHRWFVLPSKCVDKIQLCTCNVNAVGSLVITHTVEILLNREWLLRIAQGVIHWKSFKELPVFLNTINDVKEVTYTIDCAKHCPGINGARYNLLVASHKGKFYNCAGKFCI